MTTHCATHLNILFVYHAARCTESTKGTQYKPVHLYTVELHAAKRVPPKKIVFNSKRNFNSMILMETLVQRY